MGPPTPQPILPSTRVVMPQRGYPNIAQVRGEGLMCVVKFSEIKSPVDFFDPAKKVGCAISAAMASRDVIARAMPQGDIIGFASPLCITLKKWAVWYRSPKTPWQKYSTNITTTP